jgi:hypothetical protein
MKFFSQFHLGVDNRYLSDINGFYKEVGYGRMIFSAKIGFTVLPENIWSSKRL